MYPDLSYLFHDLLGTDYDGFLSVFKTFGFFLALAFMAAAIVYYYELRRKASDGIFLPTPEKIVEGRPATWGEILTNILVGGIMGGKAGLAFTHFAEFRPDPAAIILSKQMHWPGAILGAALLGGMTWWEAWRKRKPEPTERWVQVWPHDRISEITVAAAIGGILGAKIFDLFDNWKEFLANPVASLASGGGLAFFGGLILGFTAVVWYQWRKKIPFLHAADAVAPSLTAGYAVGRIGCQMSGDGDWGIVNTAPKPDWLAWAPDWMWSFQYPHTVLAEAESPAQMVSMIDRTTKAVRIEGFPGRYAFELEFPVFPTPFYEVLMMIGVFAILWNLRTRLTRPGAIWFIYLILIGIERWLIEKIRVNVKHDFLGGQWTQAEIISAALVLIGMTGLAWVYFGRKKVDNQ